jgi:hydroxyacylglutathione hydrolase
VALEIESFICREDNYGVLIHDPARNLTAAIDAPDERAILDRLKARGWQLDRILTTHRHVDHIAGNLALKQAFACTIVGPAGEAGEIPGIDRAVSGGDIVAFGDFAVHVIDTPGHTEGHIAFWLPEARLAFTGDALFAMGCGRIPAGAAPAMWRSLERLAALPDETEVYCGHEYTEANARFALTVDPDNSELRRRYEAVKARRSIGGQTLPTTMRLERLTNPFLRAGSAEIRGTVGLPDAPAGEVFAEVRRRKDVFR